MYDCLNLFPFSCSDAPSAISGVFSVPNGTVLPGRPRRAELPGFMALGIGWGELGTDNAMRSLPNGPCFALRAGPSPSTMRFVL